MTEKHLQKLFERIRISFLLLVSIIAFYLFLNTWLVSESQAAGESRPKIELQIELPKEPVKEGTFFLLKVIADKPLTSIQGRFMGREISFYPEAEGHYAALVGVDVDQKLGETEVSIQAQAGDLANSIEGKVNVVSGDFPSETLKVQPRKVEPLPRDLPRIKREKALVGAVYAASEKNRYWDAPVVMPIESDVTSIFGTRRVYNGIKQSAHYGTDLRAKSGTPIVAPISGKIVLAKNLFFTGWTIIIDHGYGFFTIYGHMSKVKVKTGSVVKKGQVLGLSGATGRVSGPHLHWGAQLHGAKIDPMYLVKNLK